MFVFNLKLSGFLDKKFSNYTKSKILKYRISENKIGEFSFTNG